MDSAMKLNEKSKTNTKIAKPTIFVPGIGGSILQAKLNKTKEVDFFCYLKTSYYYRIWLNLEDLVPGAMDCFIDNMILLWNEKENKWVNNTGVDMVPVPGNAGCDYLDPYDEFTRDETLYFGLMTQAFEAAGYVREKNLTAPTYDFRLSPNEQKHYFDNMKSTIENFYNNSNGTRVLLVSHSMGCMMTLYFLNSMTQDWKDKFVDSWIPIAGPFTGATVSLKSVISGYNLGINLIPNDKAVIFNRAQSSGYWLFPTYYWGKDKVFVTTPKRNYTLDDMQQLFIDANISSLYPFYLYPRNLTDNLVQPNVKVLCMYGYNISTDYGYVYDAQFSNPVSIPGDGDGTVPSLSATKCEMWKSQQDQSVDLIGIPNVPHMYLVTDPTVIKFILSEALNV